MTVEQTSNMLDDALARFKEGITVNEYTKSLYLTKAQYGWVRAVLARYEKGEAVRHLIRPLIQEGSINIPSQVGVEYVDVQVDNSEFMQVLYERMNSTIMVIPLDMNDIHMTLFNPFRKPDQNVAYRVTMDNVFRLYCHVAPIKYEYHMCLKPLPIILEDISGAGLEIEGYDVELESELTDEAVSEIVEVAAVMIKKDIFDMPTKQQGKQGDQQQPKVQRQQAAT